MSLPKEFEQKVNLPLLAQAIHIYEERSHVGLRNTKTRSEVNRTTKKLYKQKGTGGARHGSRRAPIFVGGGVTFGPRPLRRVLNLSDKLKSQSRLLAYSLKISEKELVLVSGLAKLGKTKEAHTFLKALEKATGAKRFTFVLSEKATGITKFLRNLSQTETVFYKDANAFDIFRGGMIVMDEEIFGSSPKEEKKTVKTVKKQDTKEIKK